MPMIKDPEGFNSSPSAGFDGVFDWDFLLPAFAPTKIAPMDLDAVIERGGKFLVFETKKGETEIPRGQIITLERLVETGPFTVIILRAKTASEITGWDCWYQGKMEVNKEHIEGDSVALVAFTRRWFEWASRKG